MAIRPDSLSIPNFPALAFPDVVAPLTGHHNNFYPDEEDEDFVIPLRLKSYKAPEAKSAVDISNVAPLLNNSYQAIGSKVAMAGIREAPKIQMDGEIDTPIDEWEGVAPHVRMGLKYDDGVDPIYRLTFAQVIQAFIDGEYTKEGKYWERLDPTWFRDPFGRVYNSPRIMSFEASYVEQVPGRTTFSMTLRV